jgi:YfiR/HmsC-like
MSRQNGNLAGMTVVPPARQREDMALILALAVSWLLSWTTTSCFAQADTRRAYALKAATVYRVIEWVEWPSGSFANSNAESVIEIGLLGEIPFDDAFDTIAGKMVSGRKVVLKRISTPKDALQCQVVFIGASEKGRLTEVLSQLKNRPILTVSEVEGFLEQGGMIDLVPEGNRFVLEINREATREAGLTVSSRVLRVARLFPR